MLISIRKHPLCNDIYTRPITIVDKALLIGATIIFAAAVATTITFVAIALGPTIGGTIITVPVMICSITGSVALVTFIAHSFRRRWAVMSPLQEVARKALFPKDLKVSARVEEDIDSAMNVTFTTRDGLVLKGCWSPATNKTNNKSSAVILFHDNHANATRQFAWWKDWYNTQGVDVLAAEIRGYNHTLLPSGSNGAISACKGGELGVYLDAEAALNWVVKTKGYQINAVIAHGTSLGGAYAASLGYHYDLKGVVLDHAFTSFSKVADQKVPVIGSLFGSFAFPKGHRLNEAYNNSQDSMKWIHSKVPMITDGLSNLKKVQKMTSPLLIIQGKDDKLTPQRFGTELKLAYNKKVVSANVDLVLMDGDHMACRHAQNDSKVTKALSDFLEKTYKPNVESSSSDSEELEI